MPIKERGNKMKHYEEEVKKETNKAPYRRRKNFKKFI